MTICLPVNLANYFLSWWHVMVCTLQIHHMLTTAYSTSSFQSANMQAAVHSVAAGVHNVNEWTRVSRLRLNSTKRCDCKSFSWAAVSSSWSVSRSVRHPGIVDDRRGAVVERQCPGSRHRQAAHFTIVLGDTNAFIVKKVSRFSIV